MDKRHSEQHRKTGETDITLALELDGGGRAEISTGIAFFDHMLSQTVKHGRLDLRLQAAGDLEIDAHHTVEDCGLILGDALSAALGDKAGIRRFGNAYAPLDESLARVVIDLSGRPSLSYHVVPSRLEIGGMDADLFREFFQALTHRGRLALHIDLIRGVNAHHQMEAVFKAFGLALAAAVARTADTGVPSTKGVL